MICFKLSAHSRHVRTMLASWQADLLHARRCSLRQCQLSDQRLRAGGRRAGQDWREGVAQHSSQRAGRHALQAHSPAGGERRRQPGSAGCSLDTQAPGAALRRRTLPLTHPASRHGSRRRAWTTAASRAPPAPPAQQSLHCCAAAARRQTAACRPARPASCPAPPRCHSAALQDGAAGSGCG